MKYTLFVLLACVVASAWAQSDVTTVAAQAGSDAGAIAGQKAGADAGRQAALQAVSNITGASTTGGPAGSNATQPAATVPLADPFTQKDFDDLAKRDPGATKFFLEFDADGDKHWNQAEWIKGIRAAIERRYLPVNFDYVGTWALIPKDENGVVNLRDFLTFAAKTKANPPPGAPGSQEVNQVADVKNCGAMFEQYDKNHDAGLSLDEFRLAVAGKIRDDAVQDTYYSLPRTGPGGTLAATQWTALCTSLYGSQASGAQISLSDDPCSPNPCVRPGTVCIPDPKRCLKPNCKQYRCVSITSPLAADARQGKNEYGKCVFVFRRFDSNSDRSLSYREFFDGIKVAQAAGQISPNFKIRAAWNKLEKTPKGGVDIYEFIHLCVAIMAGEDDSQASAKEECWDVFTHFDEDRSQDLSAREFFKGMRRARRQGHLAADLNIAGVWRAQPKTSFGTLEAGPFIDFCLLMSKGDDPPIAAADASSSGGYGAGVTSTYMGATSTYSGDVVAGYGGVLMNDTQVSSVGKNNGALKYCTNAFKKADANYDGLVSVDEFRDVCTLIANATECQNYVQIFQQYHVTTGAQMTAAEFLNACKGSSVAQTAGDRERRRRLHHAREVGAEAGKAAGAVAGEAAGSRAAAFAVSKATSFIEMMEDQERHRTGGLDTAVVDGYLQ